jgi:hypothetical protein
MPSNLGLRSIYPVELTTANSPGLTWVFFTDQILSWGIRQFQGFIKEFFKFPRVKKPLKGLHQPFYSLEASFLHIFPAFHIQIMVLQGLGSFARHRDYPTSGHSHHWVMMLLSISFKLSSNDIRFIGTQIFHACSFSQFNKSMNIHGNAFHILRNSIH